MKNTESNKNQYRSPLGMFQGIVTTIYERFRPMQSPGTAQEHSDSLPVNPLRFATTPAGLMGLTLFIFIALGIHLFPLIKIKILLVSLSAVFIFCHAVLRWRQQACSLNHASKEVDSMHTEGISLNIDQKKEDIDKKIKALRLLYEEIRKQSEINQKKASLEKQFSGISEEAAASDEITRLQRLADEAREFIRDKKLYQLKQVIDIALEEATKFRSQFYQPIPDNVFETLKLSVETLKASLDIISKTTEKLKTIHNFNEHSTEKQLRTWAISLELLGEEIEHNLPYITSETLDELESACETIVLIARKKGGDAKTKREGYRRRIRFAAGFILNLVEMEREEALEEEEEVLRAMKYLSSKALNSIHCEDDEPWNPQDSNPDNENT